MRSGSTMWMQVAELEKDKHVVYVLTKSLMQVASDSALGSMKSGRDHVDARC
ncbi:hypothetical protein F2Q69_00011789 [Brassica cretica]|uniref:Uncharacterized protein n=1 Tax=Brassica cretica TaxID=69181 RepID=A0A8S9QJQ0_BRACR|nr:hypothetical protein F2Q69_00011789 [Brassica cretica]